jgi:hypothetical protein
VVGLKLLRICGRPNHFQSSTTTFSFVIDHIEICMRSRPSAPRVIKL